MTLTVGCGCISNASLFSPVVLSQPSRVGQLAMKPTRRKKEKSGSSSSRGVASSPSASTAHLSSADPIPRSPSGEDTIGKPFSGSRFSWRSRTWQSDSPSKSETAAEKQSAESTSPSLAYQSSRKHSLTVPGEVRNSHSFSQLMGHQQKHSSSASEPTSLESKKLQRSRSPSPLSTPSPSGSASLSCSSGGLAYELARKCTLSADSLLLHPEISLQSRVSDFKKRSAEEPTTSSRSAPRHHHLQPQTSAQRKMISSLSSDQIHSQLMTHEPIDGTRSASPKLTGKKSTPEPIDELQAAGGTSAQEEKRKGSVASQVFSRPGRLARLLRRTHSAGCSKDIPPYALFLREKSSRGSRPTDSGSASGSEKRRTRKQTGLGDMKQRLRFLGRRHTDSSISSVRPTPEEAKKWAESFTLLMSHKYGASLFTAFLKKEFSHENIEFWTEVENYKKSKPSRLTAKAKKIFSEYIAVKAAKEINIEVSMRQNIQSNLSAPDDRTFDAAQRKIQGLLESDAYLRFLQSDLYRELLAPPQPPQAGGQRPTSLAKGSVLTAGPSSSSLSLISPSAIVRSLSRPTVCIEKESVSGEKMRSPESNL